MTHYVYWPDGPWVHAVLCYCRIGRDHMHDEVAP